MYNQINYDALGRTQVNTAQQQQQQHQMMVNMRNLQIQKLQRGFPGMAFHKESEHGQEYRVPLQLPISQ